MGEQYGHTRSSAKRSVGPGWAGLVDRVFDKLEDLSTKTDQKIPKVTTVKEKYGYLSIYTEFSVSPLQRLIDEIEEESETICDQCGASAKQIEKDHWVFTRCENHQP